MVGGQQFDKPIKGPHVSPWRPRMASDTRSHSPLVCQPIWLTGPVTPPPWGSRPLQLHPPPKTLTHETSLGLVCHSLIWLTKASASSCCPRQCGRRGGESAGTVPSVSTSYSHEQALFLSFPLALQTLWKARMHHAKSAHTAKWVVWKGWHWCHPPSVQWHQHSWQDVRSLCPATSKDI